MSDLKTNYKDDVLDVSANVKRIFNLVDQDGKIVVANVSIQDITKYTQEGDSFGAADINATNEAVNGKLDGSSTVDPMLATEEGFAADAYQTKLQLEEQNKNMGGLRFGVDGDGNYGYYGADDSLIPFKSGEFSIKEHSGNSLNEEKTYILFMYHTGTPSCTGKNCTVTTLATWTSYNSDKTIFLGAFKITNVKADASYSSPSRSIKCYEISAE